MNVVTGAFSFTGRAIAEALLARGESVRSLSRRDPVDDPLRSRVDVAPLRFDDGLGAALKGVSVLYNTYWIRFERDGHTFDEAVGRTVRLFQAARAAGVQRIVHVSVSHADAAPDLPYFAGKAQIERWLAESDIPHVVVRPTLVFGDDDILINNIAWILRRSPLFLLPGNGSYEVQPVSIADVARLCIETPNGETVDAAGPEVVSFDELVRQIGAAVSSRSKVFHGPVAAALALVRIANLALRDVVVTKDELAGLSRSLLTSANPATGVDRLSDWLARAGSTIGLRYTSELARNFHGQK